MTPGDANKLLIDASREAFEAQSALDAAVVEAARARHDYRKAKAESYLRIKAEHARSSERVTVDEMRARVDIACCDERLAAYLAEGLEYAAKQRQRLTADALSAAQTQANLVRDEMRFDRTGPDMAGAV